MSTAPAISDEVKKLAGEEVVAITDLLAAGGRQVVVAAVVIDPVADEAYYTFGHTALCARSVELAALAHLSLRDQLLGTPGDVRPIEAGGGDADLG
ncbi:MAG: hypothetical protein RQ833_07495 [Sphingomonadaceae bacterium]|nr:hypothetical protein [Sphingomonadaceae bacterium]